MEAPVKNSQNPDVTNTYLMHTLALNDHAGSLETEQFLHPEPRIQEKSTSGAG